ncbi:hypothetical protein E6O75_ATG11268 [Venturia nashicola]|uniref:Uncharacterized protein n=1 Tax=Venturia nashicola TaxID=86259 RepID=A0A4Z1PKS1_9PEZI|nr:hypothetical protein E6O75_ATG11268 [Venturia nashicola]
MCVDNSTILISSVTERAFHFPALLKYVSTPLLYFITLISELFHVLNALIVYIFTALAQRSSICLSALFSVIHRSHNQNLYDYLLLMITVGFLLCLLELFTHLCYPFSPEIETKKRDRDGARGQVKDRAETSDGAEDGPKCPGEADTDAACQYDTAVKEKSADDNEAEVHETEDEAEQNPDLKKRAEISRHSTPFPPGLSIKGKAAAGFKPEAELCGRDEQVDSRQAEKIDSISQICLQRDLEGEADEQEVEKDWDLITADSEEDDDDDDDGEEEKRIHWPLTMQSRLYYTCLYILLGLFLLIRDPKSGHHYHHHISSSLQPQLCNHCGILDIFRYIELFDSLLHSRYGTTVLFEALLLWERNGSRGRDATRCIALYRTN